ncbi:MAG: hypothetical protein FWD06_06610 [Oscillospiraceae bacterium]|nr:hypothetical protein [Oscillospiraceae bacterium]
MNCPYCGNQGQTWHKNCTACGAAYPENTATQQPQSNQFAQPPQQQQPWGQPQQQPWQQQQAQQPWAAPVKQTDNVGVVLGVLSIIFGVLALTLPVPFLDIAFGVAGIVMAAIAGSKGQRGLRIAGLIVSILGTVVAFFYTLGTMAFL